MCNTCTQNINAVFQNLAVGQEFMTPDNQRPANFSISAIGQNSVTILPQNNGLIITREAFESALHYLVENNHTVDHVCEIRSNNLRRDAGPLCIAARDQNRNVRCINYILPILAHNNLVGIDGTRSRAHPRNTTWLL
jgi:2-polyprenyl-6-methoxyphenol hydroxylase-like FAD-dependent oxidoreductase